MLNLIKFCVLANISAFALTCLAYFTIPPVGQMKVIDLLFIIGVLFWLISTVVRLFNKRVKKEWNKDQVTLSDPQLVISTDNLATRFLIAGMPGILGAIIWGFFY